MKMITNRVLTWSAIRYIRSNIRSKFNTSLSSCRFLYSKTGQWEKSYNQDVRRELEAYWQPIIHEQNSQSSPPNTGRPKYYVLSMFPYPSGKLHMGHVRVYTISDTMARYNRLKGKEVIHPMGWDAFGLPAENAAIQRGEPPDLWTKSNIASMREQLDALGCSFDWHREYATCDPAYYRWTQYFFLKMFDAGLVYQKEGEVNWDPVDQTVLADEQISEEGLSWRSGAKVEKRYLRQWYIRTTAYAKSLWDGLEEVNSDFWREVIKLQRHWIGECTGCRFNFKLKLEDTDLPDSLTVHTDNPEMVYGVSHICLSPEHRFSKPEYQMKQTGADAEYSLMRLTAVHPLTGEELPVVATSSVQYAEFQDTHMGIPSKCDIDRRIAETLGLNLKEVFDNGILVNSEQFSGQELNAARTAIMKHARELGVGGFPVSSRLRDWLISRQRYWGTPIPIVHCPNCKAVPVPYSSLPVELPQVSQLTGRGTSPLATDDSWRNVECPKCGGPAHRETDTMDTFVDSSWYFLRYLDPDNQEEPCSQQVAHQYMPVDLYIGGMEHATLHLYFARFFNHFLYDLGLVPQREPFVNLLTQGMVMGQTYKVKSTGQYLRPDQVDLSGSRPVDRASGQEVVKDWEKMSKSKHNGVDPQEVMSEFGIDSTRLCILFNVAPQSHRKWSHDAFKGILNWQSRIWVLVSDFLSQNQTQTLSSPPAESVVKLDAYLNENRNYFLTEINFHMETTFLLSVAISRLQGLTNSLKKTAPELMPHSVEFQRAVCDLVIMMSSLAPHFASELWEGLRSLTNRNCQDYLWDKSVLEQAWPVVDENYKLRILVKVNAKDACEVRVSRDELATLTLDTAHDLFKLTPEYQECVQGQEVKDIKLIVKPGYQAELNLAVKLKGPKEKKKKKEKKEKKEKKKASVSA